MTPLLAEGATISQEIERAPPCSFLEKKAFAAFSSSSDRRSCGGPLPIVSFYPTYCIPLSRTASRPSRMPSNQVRIFSLVSVSLAVISHRGES